MHAPWLRLFLTSLTVAALAGCGSSGGSGGSAVTPSTEPVLQASGITNCTQCHSAQNQAFLAGRHANLNGSPTGPHEPAAAGEPFSCGNCHNATLDAINMPAAYGLSVRDVVACEACHGNGSAHRGIGPIPIPRPGVAECARCHAEVSAETGELVALRSRSGHSPGALNVVPDYLASGHAAEPRDRSTRSETIGCNRCHSDEGARLYRGLTTVAAITATNGRGAEPLGEENISPIQCRTCHDVHATGGDQLLMAASADGSAQYNTCSHCHADNAALDYHFDHFDDNGLMDRSIRDTHFDDPTTTKLLEGYVLRTQAATACADCHNVHHGDNSINQQWARSAHGGHLLDVKEAEGPDAAVGSATADGWVHYPWESDARQGCQRCHTATGVANYLDDPNGYSPANNDFSHLAAWNGASGSPQAEMLYCWGCHSNAGAGTLRNPGAIALKSTGGTAVTYQGAPVVLPDIANSNVCVACHGGAGNMDSSMSSRFVGHHAPAGGTLFSAVTHMGFEFPGQSYANPSYFAHDSLDLEIVDILDHGTVIGQQVSGAGPCAACHMSSSEGHRFSVVEKNAAGEITALTATNCSGCHDGSHGAALEAGNAAAAAFLEEESAGYQQAGMVLGAYLANSLPNFLGTTINNTTADLLATYAFQNQKLPTEEPGGYAHNRLYVKRLLFDSIDYLDNGVLDGTININAANYPAAAHWLGSSRP
ncbi:MAG: cytochrome c3 family protein [Desulfuromonas thiophila]|nr:cytochrome c3 family protein [Desulfuromonas thiophila]